MRSVKVVNMTVVTLVMVSTGVVVLGGVAWLLVSLGHAWLAALPLMLVALLLYVIVGILTGKYPAD